MRKTGSATLTALLMALLLCVGFAYSQPPEGGGPPEPFFDDPDDEMGPGEAQKQEVKELLSTVYLMELTKELGLSKEQALDISMIVEKEEKAKEGYQKALRDAIRGLRHELGNDKPNEGNLKKYIADAKLARDRMKSSATETRDKILAKLSVTQQAKFILFHGKWTKKMHRIRDHIRNERMRKGRGPGMGPGMGQGPDSERPRLRQGN